MCGSVLKGLECRVGLEVERKQHSVLKPEETIAERRLCLVRLDATERCKLRFALCDAQNGRRSILTNVGSQQTAKESQLEASGGADKT